MPRLRICKIYGTFRARNTGSGLVGPNNKNMSVEKKKTSKCEFRAPSRAVSVIFSFYNFFSFFFSSEG